MKFKSQLFVFALVLGASQFLVAQDTNFTLTLTGVTDTDSSLPTDGSSIASGTPFDISIGFNTSSPNISPLGADTAEYVATSEQVTVGGSTFNAIVEPGDVVGLADPSWCPFGCSPGILGGPWGQDLAGFAQGGGNNGFLPIYSASVPASWSTTSLPSLIAFPVLNYENDLETNMPLDASGDPYLNFTIAGDPDTLDIDYSTGNGVSALLSVPEGGSSTGFLLLAGAVCFGAMFFKRRGQLTASV